MSTYTDKTKKKYRQLKLELIKSKGKIFCMLYAPIIVAVLEIIVDGYRAYTSKTKGGSE